MDSKKTDNLKGETKQEFINFLKGSISEFDKLFEAMENNGGWFPLEDQAIESLSELDPPWHTLYENKERLFRLSYEYCCGEVVVAEKLTNSFLKHATESVKQPDESIKPFIPDPDKTSDQQDHSQESMPATTVSLAQLFNLLALMIHRRSMCQLIIDAKNGDDEALCLAVQVDRTVLQIPYFQKRLLKAQFSNDGNFLDKLAYRIKTPVLQSSVKHRTLHLTFAILDDIGVIYHHQPKEILNICKQTGVTGSHSDVNEDNKFYKLLKKYKEKARI